MRDLPESVCNSGVRRAHRVKDITGHEKQIGRDVSRAIQHLAKRPRDISLTDVDPVLVSAVVRTVSQVKIGSVN
jgi:hypothetical protein